MCPSSCFLPVCRFVGYRAGACTHGEGVVTALIVLFSPVPIALLLMGMIFFHFYPIDERRSLQLQEQLTTDQWVDVFRWFILSRDEQWFLTCHLKKYDWLVRVIWFWPLTSRLWFFCFLSFKPQQNPSFSAPNRHTYFPEELTETKSSAVKTSACWIYFHQPQKS